jgi:hypothetical protein
LHSERLGPGQPSQGSDTHGKFATAGLGVFPGRDVGLVVAER